MIHLLSASARAPFVKRAAAALDEAGLAAAFEEAGAGTLYLDEIAALPRARNTRCSTGWRATRERGPG